MSRTKLSIVAAGLLVATAVAVFVARRTALGADPGGPSGRSAWEVTVSVRGELAGPDASIVTAGPPDFRHQHVADETWKSDGLLRRDLRDTKGRPGADRETAW